MKFSITTIMTDGNRGFNFNPSYSPFYKLKTKELLRWLFNLCGIFIGKRLTSITHKKTSNIFLMICNTRFCVSHLLKSNIMIWVNYQPQVKVYRLRYSIVTVYSGLISDSFYKTLTYSSYPFDYVPELDRHASFGNWTILKKSTIENLSIC